MIQSAHKNGFHGPKQITQFTKSSNGTKSKFNFEHKSLINDFKFRKMNFESDSENDVSKMWISPVKYDKKVSCHYSLSNTISCCQNHEEQKNESLCGGKFSQLPNSCLASEMNVSVIQYDFLKIPFEMITSLS